MPEALSVVGYGDLDFAASRIPPLTTLRPHRGQIGSKPMQALIGCCEQPKGQLAGHSPRRRLRPDTPRYQPHRLTARPGQARSLSPRPAHRARQQARPPQYDPDPAPHCRRRRDTPCATSPRHTRAKYFAFDRYRTFSKARTRLGYTQTIHVIHIFRISTASACSFYVE
ncbi:hypothetical protein GZH52_12005 [Crenobacter sp. HX-7-9]|uniref:Uncharacterized protein n=1 Tax=Crenobacter caeni TaxID=2705474 RepID=A0A6B2KU63_9NEIS|nr:hypothetical protein [Crenobacter caeni]